MQRIVKWHLKHVENYCKKHLTPEDRIVVAELMRQAINIIFKKKGG